MGLGAGSPAAVDVGHKATRQVLGSLFGSCSWDQLLPSSVLGASRASLPSDGEEVGGCPEHR